MDRKEFLTLLSAIIYCSNTMPNVVASVGVALDIEVEVEKQIGIENMKGQLKEMQNG